MEAHHVLLLLTGAFCVGACPFSLWVGQHLLKKDIRNYGDGNPGAVNVFRAGGRKSGGLAVLLDVGKGTPFVILAHSLFSLSGIALGLIGLSAILGSAFSPLLRFRGGKSIAVTYGVLLALPYHEMVLAFAVFMLLGFLFIKEHSWIVMMGPTGAVAFLAITRASYWQVLFMLSVLAILAIKHRSDLRVAPKFELKLVNWLHSKI